MCSYSIYTVLLPYNNIYNIYIYIHNQNIHCMHTYHFVELTVHVHVNIHLRAHTKKISCNNLVKLFTPCNNLVTTL